MSSTSAASHLASKLINNAKRPVALKIRVELRQTSDTDRVA
jgi:hypothetical protein